MSYDYHGPAPQDCVGEVKRTRRNDYVGAPIWGIDTALDLAPGDLVYEDDDFMRCRRIYRIGHENGAHGLALAAFYTGRGCHWHPGQLTCRERFVGFVTRRCPHCHVEQFVNPHADPALSAMDNLCWKCVRPLIPQTPQLNTAQ